MMGLEPRDDPKRLTIGLVLDYKWRIAVHFKGVEDIFEPDFIVRQAVQLQFVGTPLEAPLTIRSRD